MKLKSQSGSILLSTLSFIILLAVAAASILELTMNSYKLTMRNEMRAQARAVAESELEYVYFQWVGQILSGVNAADTPASLVAANIAVLDNPDVNNPVDPFLVAHKGDGWKVARSVSYNAAYDFFDGIIPGNGKQGKISYITIKVVVLPKASSFFHNELAVRVGRRFSTSNTSIFQYGVFYQGDLEMSPGNNMTVDGDVAANGSIYLASLTGATLTLNKKVQYLTGYYFNQDSDGNTVLRKPDTLPGGVLVAPVFLTSQASQVSPLDHPENLLGGLDVSEIIHRRPDLFTSENDVYRAAILPPPSEAPDEYPTADTLAGDDSVIAASRMYNRAGLRITVNDTTNAVTITKVDGTPTGTDVTATYASAIVGPANADVWDGREGKYVKMTTVDMGVLLAAINANYPTGSSDFNGAIYFNLKNSTASTPRGVKIINATDVTGRKGNGTTIATNGGMYVKGNFNTASTPLDGGTNPATIMADQVTVLSNDWNDADSAHVIDPTHRQTTTTPSLTINAGILTGSTASTATGTSGGVQNLVRYLEDWTGKTVTFHGSIGRLFESKTFESVFQQPNPNVYKKPGWRTISFDDTLVKHPPAGSPTTTDFKRGSFFVW